jgi:hypothetical protein
MHCRVIYRLEQQKSSAKNKSVALLPRCGLPYATLGSAFATSLFDARTNLGRLYFFYRKGLIDVVVLTCKSPKAYRLLRDGLASRVNRKRMAKEKMRWERLREN